MDEWVHPTVLHRCDYLSLLWSASWLRQNRLVKEAHGDCLYHRPYCRKVRERMDRNVVIHPPTSIQPKAGEGALCDQWVIKYNCQNDSSSVVFTVCNFVHSNKNTTHGCKSQQPLSIYVFAIYISFLHPTLTPLLLISGIAECPQNGRNQSGPKRIRQA